MKPRATTVGKPDTGSETLGLVFMKLHGQQAVGTVAAPSGATGWTGLAVDFWGAGSALCLRPQVVSEANQCAKTSRVGHFRFTHFIVCMLWLNKT